MGIFSIKKEQLHHYFQQIFKVENIFFRRCHFVSSRMNLFTKYLNGFLCWLPHMDTFEFTSLPIFLLFPRNKIYGNAFSRIHLHWYSIFDDHIFIYIHQIRNTRTVLLRFSIFGFLKWYSKLNREFERIISHE